MSRSFSLSWSRFVPIALVLGGLPAFMVYADYRSGDLDAASFAVPVFAICVLAFFALRWQRMRQDFAAGRLTEAGFRANPLASLAGRPVHAAIWFGVSLLLSMAPLVWWIYQHRSGA